MGEMVTIPREEYERLLALAEDVEDAVLAPSERGVFGEERGAVLDGGDDAGCGRRIALGEPGLDGREVGERLAGEADVSRDGGRRTP